MIDVFCFGRGGGGWAGIAAVVMRRWRAEAAPTRCSASHHKRYYRSILIPVGKVPCAPVWRHPARSPVREKYD